MDSFYSSLFIYLVLCYSLLFAFFVPLDVKIPWVKSNLMRKEHMVDQMCDETILLGSTKQKLSIPKRRMASNEPGKFA